MFIIAGLGNPSREYEKTRHNVGFEAIDLLADKLLVNLTDKKHRACCGIGMIGTEKVILSKPQTYMNLSGESIGSMADYYKVEPDHIIVICDDINLEEGQLRIRAKGSAGGHNGLKSIINHLGSQEFLRIRVGVGEKPKEMDLADYVLGRFPKAQEALMEDAYKAAAEASIMVVEDGADAAMNLYNRKK
ncbi:aminoacyl-tRNA hydrolase [Lacrimispora algidixylanolytica]|uniref:Peptidyl-tRNA hydrolase n=1 Tax=Lacrimispora algidixylanolytica TaxID=94868 RepID=A0A419TCG2_9FIRM|nr:aminoacyl-tRNA hydrolase [Lacrimispora algidixylanolytica]RKD35166.1 aminoacyl-tRNA hydrolase [Lacrimispora algidixylanolytica]